MKNGLITYEDYWNDYTAKDTVHVMSATKSVFSLIIGIAIDQGLIKSIDQPILIYGGL